jgi:hypothetical protein
MKTIKPHFDQFALDHLKLELLKKIGWIVSNKPDCAKLSDLIADSELGIISESTLYRLFLKSDSHTPYKSTLDILCQFIGYKDCIDFLEKIETSREESYKVSLISTEDIKNSLLYYCINNRSKNALSDFFDSANTFSYNQKIKLSILLFDSLLISTNQDWFFEHFAEKKFIREYFFERAHDPLFRIKNYDKAYLSYLKGIDKKVNSVISQDFVFGNCVLFRFYFTTGKIKEALLFGDKLFKAKLAHNELKNQLYIFPFIRYSAYYLWQLELKKVKESEINNYAGFLIDLSSKLKDELPFMEQKILFHTVAETFIFSKISENYHWDLKKVFIDMFRKLPESVYKKHLKYSLPYFNENGLLHYRPN